MVDNCYNRKVLKKKKDITPKEIHFIMGIISCPKCRKSYRVNDDVIGSTVECTACHTTFTATVSSISLKPVVSSVGVQSPVNPRIDKKWLALFIVVCVMTIIQFSMLIVLVTQGGTGGGPSLIAGQAVASLPSGTPSELLLKYTEQGETSYVEAVLKQNPSFDINRPRAANNKTLLYIACENGYSDIVKLFLKRKADVSFVAKSDYSPLTIAARNGHIAVVKVLLSAGVDIEARDANNETALYVAAENNKPSVVQFLCESKAQVNVYGINKWTPLTMAASKGHVKVVDVLLKYGTKVDLEMRDDVTASCRKTPLYYAATGGYPDVVEMLCKAGADVNAYQGAYSGILKNTSNPEVIKILKKYGAE